MPNSLYRVAMEVSFHAVLKQARPVKLTGYNELSMFANAGL